jgi:DNA-binding NarL/FixJ family response regulator
MSMSTPSVDPYVPTALGEWPRRRRVAIALENERTRDALVSLLAAGGLAVNAGAVSLRRVDELVADPPDALVLVAELDTSAALAALRRVRRHAPDTRIVVVARDTSAIAARESLNAGADAYVSEALVEQSLAAAVHATLVGLVCAPRDVRRLVAKPTFSHREKEVLGLLVAGLTNGQIAAQLFLAESTVKSHLATAFAKLGVRSRKDAAALLLDPAEGLAATALPPEALSAVPALPSVGLA